MTTIIGIQRKGGFTLAADSVITAGDRIYEHRSVPKITEVGDYVLAGAGVSRYCDVVLYGWQPPKYDNSNPYIFMVSKFIPEMRKMHEDTGYTLKEDDSFEFIIGLKNNLYYIGDDYSVLLTKTNMYGIGSGAAYALGALSAGADIVQAMKIASQYDINTGGRIQIIERGV